MRIRHPGGEDLLARTKKFALRVIKLFAALPRSGEAHEIGRQVFRSGTSIGAQIAEAAHAKSRADFISKIEGSLQEAEESKYWLELLIESGTVKESKLRPLHAENCELIAILTAIASKSRHGKD